MSDPRDPRAEAIATLGYYGASDRAALTWAMIYLADQLASMPAGPPIPPGPDRIVERP